MSVAKLNRLIRMSEAVKGVCDLVDDGKLTISVASEMSALKTKTQESVLHLLDLGYKATNERISRIKKAEGGGTKLGEMDLRNILDDKDLKPQRSEAPATPTPGTAPEPPGVATDPPTIPPSPDIPAVSEVPAPQDAPTAADPPQEKTEKDSTQEQAVGQPLSGAVDAVEREKEDNPFKGAQERAEVTKVILTGDRLRKYFPDVSITPREIEESVYSALEERRQRQLKEQQKAAIFKRSGTTR